MLVPAAIGAAGAAMVVAHRRTGGLVTALADGTRDWRRGAGV